MTKGIILAQQVGSPRHILIHTPREVCHKFGFLLVVKCTTTKPQRRQVLRYNLQTIIGVGYRSVLPPSTLRSRYVQKNYGMHVGNHATFTFV